MTKNETQFPAFTESVVDRLSGKSLVEWHQVNGGDVGAAAYTKRYRDQLIAGLSKTRTVYLDTNYWVWLRQAELGTGTDAQRQLLDTLRAMVRSREVICVSQFNSFAEIGEQEEASLRVTAALMDELTEGVVIAQSFDLWEWDCARFLEQRFDVHVSMPVSNWTKVGHIHRHGLPEDALVDATPAARETTLRCVTDVTWNTTFEDVFSAFGWQTKQLVRAGIDDEVIARVEALKKRQLADGKTREHVRQDAFADLLNDQLKPVFKKQLSVWNREHRFPTGLAGAVRQFAAVLGDAMGLFARRTLGSLLPSTAILAELYALYESAPNRKPLTTNDWADWNHAAAALPHCDFFLTERNLAHLIRQELRADDQYDCAVAGKLQEAIELLTHS
jgi:hypothetical protein